METSRTRPRSGHMTRQLVITIGGEIYNKNYLNSVDCYNVDRGQWTRLKELPFPRCHHGAALYESSIIYVAGIHSCRCYCCPQRSCGKVMSSQACVKNSFHGGAGEGCIPACTPRPVYAGIYTHPQADTPLTRQTPPLTRQTPPLGRHPPPDTPWADTPLDRHPPWADTHLDRHPHALGRHPLDRHPHAQCMLGYTHPPPSDGH